MLLALDYDQTYTRDPDFWDELIAAGLRRGHRFVCVTNRSVPPGSAKAERTPSPAIPVVCAGDRMKADAARDAGYAISIWIDDIPASISQIPEPAGDGFQGVLRRSLMAAPVSLVVGNAPTAQTVLNVDPSEMYQPEIWLVKKDTIYAAMPALEAAIEHTTELLAHHDVSLGRTTLKNRTWAERLEADIRQMRAAHALLQAEPQSRE